MTIDTLRQLNDLMTVLNNTKAKLDKNKADKSDKTGLDFSEILAKQIEDPVKQSAVTQTVIKPVLHLNVMDTSCSKCGKPGKYMIRGRWYCKECADGIQE